ncbi:MAG TPA: BON domain-containing protein [Planctomycetia bacterium]|nr:BON domain-containing protein [Planctomycetia bacterium]
MHELLLLVCVAAFVSDDLPPLPDGSSETAPKKSSVWPWTKKDAEKVERPWSLSTWLGRFRDRPSDGVLRVRCQNALFADRELRASPIKIQAKDGAVELSGSVDSRDLAERAERIARRTAGVKSVKNAIAFEGDGERPASIVGMQLGAPVATASATAENPAQARSASEGSDALVDSSPTQTRVANGGTDAASNDSVLAPAHAKTPASPAELLPVSSTLNGSVLASRPQTVQVDPRLPRVTTYAIRRTSGATKTAAPAAEVPERADASVRRPIPAPRNRRAAIINRGEEGGAREVSVVPVSRAAPKSDLVKLIDAEFQSDPAATNLKYRLEGSRILLSGSTSSPERLFKFIDRLAAIPGVGGVDTETGKMTFRP